MFEGALCFLLNSICCLLYRSEYKKYIAISDVQRVQKEKLFQILNKNKACEYGSRYNFEDIGAISEFQNRIPITTYEDYLDYIAKIKNGAKNVLTSEAVLLLEPTSGSASASKYIPYTQSLKEEFQRGLKPWIYNLYQECQGVKWGKSYWSVTPATTLKKYTNGGIPIGFDEDSEYFGYLEKKLYDLIFAVPGSVAQEKEIAVFYYKSALGLLICKNLTLISIWNPTFLLLLIEYMEQNCERLAAAISKRDKARGRKIREFINERRFDKVWPKLKVISCWCAANAKNYATRLQDYFPDVTIQPKGLLATEGFISFPLWGDQGGRISLYSHFFEFLSLEDNQIYLAHQLEKGKEYSVIITTSGGLYRYLLNDIIEVIGFDGVFPLVEFRGKLDKVSDLFGEKLNEIFVKETIDKLDLKPEFYMLAPEKDGYVLYFKGGRMPVGLDDALRENFHYDYCRKLGQLKELRLFKLAGDPYRDYLQECVKRGQRLGNIKPTALHLEGGWDQVFQGEYL